ncbi:MAG: hypothetical protein EOO92_11530, partial [Pedobacter sp.]
MKQLYKRILFSFIIIFALLFSNKVNAQYAIGGTAGNMVKSVYWLRWDPSTMLTHPSAFTSTSSNIVAGTYMWQYSPTARITAVLSNFGGNAPIKPYTPGNYQGDGLDLIYSGNNLPKNDSRGVANSGISVSQSPGNTGLGEFDIDIKVEMLISGVWTDIDFPGMIIGDAESIDGSGEYFSAKTTATAWQLLNKHTNSPTNDPTYALTLTNSGKDFNVNVTSGNGNLGIQAVMYAHGVHKLTDVKLKGSGTTAIALGFVFPFDLGDAPATYGSEVAHYIDKFTYSPFSPVADGVFPIVTYPTATLVPKANVYIGSANVDADGTAVHTPLADGDNNTQNDDESTLTPSGLVDIKVNQSGDIVIPQFPVTNLNATPATVYMWLDFNNDGVFSADEVRTVSVPANSTNFNVNITFPNSQFASKIKAGPLYGRIRITGSAISDDPATTNFDERSTAFAGDGETEDYKFKDILGLTIAGKVVNDGNGRTDNVISGTGLNTLGASPITAYLIDNSTSLIVAKTSINADGTYTFSNIANNGTFVVAISTVSSALVGANISTIPANLPSGWNAVGEAFGVNNNVTGIEAGTPNLQIQVVTPGTSLDVTNVDFALDQSPVAVNDNSGTVNIDVNITVDILANDTDPNGNNTINLTSVKLIDPADGLEKTVVTTIEGVYTVNATTGAVTFDPVSTFTGTTGSTAATTIKYTVLDNAGVKSNQGILTIKVKPVGATDNDNTFKDVAVTTTVKANDDNGVASLTTVISTDTTNPSHGVIVVNGDGTIKYTPNSGYIGTDSYTYKLTSPDGTVKSDPITVNITVNAPNNTLAGNVFNDANGLSDLIVNGSPYTLANLNVIAYNNTTGKVEAISPVSPLGSYNLTVLSNNNYTLYLTTNNYTVGSTVMPTVALPTGWVNTGEHVGSGAGSDTTVDGVLAIGTINTNQTNLNFGVEQIPTAGSGTNVVTNPGATTQVAIPANTFSNTVASSDPSPGAVTGIRITGFPTNTTSIVINGITYTSANQAALNALIIPTNSAGEPTVSITIDPIEPGSSVINFVAIDAAGKSSTTVGTATVTVNNNLPVSNPVTAVSQSNPGGTVKVAVPTLTGTDTEDGTYNGTSLTNTIRIITLPTGGTLYYDNVAVTANQTIANYDPAKLTLDPNNGVLSVNFTYSHVDTDNGVSTPATVSIPFSNTPPTTNNITNPAIASNQATPVDINNPTGADIDGTVTNYKIITLPTTGTLYLADGTTLVTAGQVLTVAEANGLKFKPSGTSNATVTFTLAAIDNQGAEDATPATFEIPLTNTPPTTDNINNPAIASNTATPVDISNPTGADVDGTVT